LQYARGFSRESQVKTYQIEVQRIKAMANSKGLVQAKIDALVLPLPARNEGEPSTIISFSEENARVLMLLLKQQLSEIDGRKARSQR
jgi:hypothetical protein